MAVPNSVLISRTINAERLVLLGWPRAILLQCAHPLIAAAIFDHSGFRATPWAAVRRLQHTVRAMLALTFGDETERERALQGIRTIHRRVRGRLPVDVGPFPAGTLYSAEDPDLVLWVHATLLESIPIFYEMLVAPLSTAERNAYCEEAAPLAVALGARESDVPRSWSALDRYFERMYGSGQIVVSSQARELAAGILSPPFGVLAGPATSISRLLTLGTLSASIRRQYGLAWTPREERALALAVPTFRALRRMVPRVLASWGAARAGRRDYAETREHREPRVTETGPKTSDRSGIARR